MRILISLASIHNNGVEVKTSTPEDPYKKWLKTVKKIKGFDRTLAEKNGLVKAVDKEGKTISIYAPSVTHHKKYPVVRTNTSITEVDPNEPILLSEDLSNNMREPPATATVNVW